MYLKIYLGLYPALFTFCPAQSTLFQAHIINVFVPGVFFFSFQAENKKQNLYPVYKNDDEYDPGNYRPMSLLSIFSRMYHRLIRAYNHGQKLLTHENYQRFSLV